MADQSSIEWTDATWNPVTGCSKVSPGCEHCYAVRETNRHRNLSKYTGLVRGMEWTGEVRCHPELLGQPMAWREPRRVFVCSMSDLFHSKVPWEFITRVFWVMATNPQHTFQVLTKRPGRMAHFAEHVWPNQPEVVHIPHPGWPANVWAGTSVESQKYAPRLAALSKVPAKVRFVSVEPLLERVDLTRHSLTVKVRDTLADFIQWSDETVSHPEAYRRAEEFNPKDQDNVAINPLTGEWFDGWDAGQERRWVDWVICGGESGPGARPMHPDWARSLRDDCQAAGVPFFFKQWGGWAPTRYPNLALSNRGRQICFDANGREQWIPSTPGMATMERVGKKAAGALLDGREWREVPECTV